MGVFDRRRVNAAAALVTARTFLTHFTATESITVRNLAVFVTAAGAVATTLSKLGIYSVAANEDVTLLGATANDPTFFTNTNRITRALTAPVAIVKDQRYAFAVLTVSTAGMPSMSSSSMGGNTQFLALEAPIINSSITSTNDLPATSARATLSGSIFGYYGELLP